MLSDLGGFAPESLRTLCEQMLQPRADGRLGVGDGLCGIDHQPAVRFGLRHLQVALADSAVEFDCLLVESIPLTILGDVGRLFAPKPHFDWQIQVDRQIRD